VNAKLGRESDAEKVLKELRTERQSKYVSGFFVSRVCIGLGPRKHFNGNRPHPRQWQSLAQILGLSPDVSPTDFLGARRIQRDTVLSDKSNPSFNNSP
jgi:hypothetical protein